MPPTSPAEQMPATFREWVEILARIRFGTVKIAGKSVTGPRIKLVAGRLATYSDSNGTRVRPGIARLAVDLEMDYRLVGSIVAYLRRLGLLGLIRAGKGARADEYRLTLPVDLLERDDLEVWSPTQQATEIERLRTARRGVRKSAGGDPDGPDGTRTHVPEGDAHAEDAHVPQGDAQTAVRTSHRETRTENVHVPEGDKKEGVHVPEGDLLHVPEGDHTDQDQYTTTTDHPDEALCTAVTVTREPGPATTSPEPLPQRCEHGLPGGRRKDGLLACPICRRAERLATAPPPTGETPSNVIPLNPRRAS